MQKILLFIFFVLITISCSTKMAKHEIVEKCLNYEPDQVQLIGFLYSKSFPGPPNYEDIKNGDEEEIYWLIKTMTSFCVNESNQIYGDRLDNQSEVQLVISSKLNLYKTKRSLLNKKVSVKGTLFPQMTGHHKTKVLITVETIEQAHE